MASLIPVYVEVGRRRVFAGAVLWPGWCRSGKDEESALQALLDYGRRYKAALRRVGRGFQAPADESALQVVERLRGSATTDFGAPDKTPSADEGPLDDNEAKRQAAILRAAWSAFDRAAKDAIGATFRKGPRGGGRELDGIVDHVLGAERAYLSPAGGEYRAPPGADGAIEMAGIRRALLKALSARARGEPPPRTPRSGKLWAPTYAVRRSAWHALDHAWEIEDRAT
ncbi:MAG: hypothetical protein H0W94_01935 [Actinobacteria bacterium]|nr:hypothetical protein [Actinomycetota bacterium]